jgi:carboxyl-terminal processing protease
MNASKKRIRYSVAGICASLGAALLLLTTAAKPAEDPYFEISKNLEIFADLYKEVQTYYVDDVDPSNFVRTGIDAMLKSLDPYTNFISESEIEDFRFMTTGEYGGIGAGIQKRGKYVEIRTPYEGFPAQKAGLRAGDAILEIDGKDVEGYSTEEIKNLLRGQPDTEVTVVVKRLTAAGTKQLTIDVVRQEVTIPNVPYYGEIEEGIGYISLTGFRRNAGSEVRDAVQSLIQQDSIDRLILDLRGNPGGLLNEAVNIVSIFVPKGNEVVSTRGKVDEWDKTYHTNQNPETTELPLAVLVNENSASASEIVAGAVQDYDRGVIIGKRTFGKGLVQTTRPLSYNTQLKVTTAKYYIPSGRCIQALDYSKRDEKGRALQVPDSLISAYETAGGRTVYDGAGIRPDIATEEKSLGEITKTLIRQDVIFDYATRYRNARDTIIDPLAFRITDSTFNAFVGYVSQQDFNFVTSSQKSLKKFKENAKEDRYFDMVEGHIKDIEKKLSHDKSEDVKRFEDEIRHLLEVEIAERYYYQVGRIKSSISHDHEIDKAKQVLDNSPRYASILTPNGRSQEKAD